MEARFVKSTHPIPRFDPVARDPDGLHAYITPLEFAAVLAWCEEHFGPGKDRLVLPENTRWCYNWHKSIWLSRPDDAFHFKMRWC